MPNARQNERNVTVTVTGDALDDVIDELDELADASKLEDTASEGEITELNALMAADKEAGEALTAQTANVLKHWLLVVVVNDTNTDSSPRWNEDLQRYIRLLADTYGAANVEVKGADVFDDEDGPLTEEEFIVTLKDEKDRRILTRDPQGRKFYSQIHIVGHGDATMGLIFKDRRPFVRQKEVDAGRTAAGISPLIERAGKVVVAACHAARGQLPPWLRETLGEGRVHAVEGDFYIPWLGDYSIPEGWHSHPSLRGIADFLGIDYEGKVRIKPTGPKPIPEDRSQTAEALTVEKARDRKIRPARPLRTR